ncbi:MAG: hypothetical protein P8R54_31990 [Myxococcota bacterium]|nr:hypothetical protein [Myxococcota bacterium]
MTKNPWIAAALNFFFPGSGYIYTGRRRLLGAGFLLGALGLTVVEQSASIFPALGIEAAGLQAAAPEVFGLMFAVVFLMNTVFAVDAYVEAKAV